MPTTTPKCRRKDPQCRSSKHRGPHCHFQPALGRHDRGLHLQRVTDLPPPPESYHCR
uniref:Uncharacterized protein n=1 Tax=Lepeophtheirus salmonis TaxID=72036 RepID=A0A0K2UQM9_LEPSM